MRNEMIGTVAPTKGELVEGVTFISFDLIPNCSGEDCTIYDQCTYNKIGKCTVVQIFMSKLRTQTFKSIPPEKWTQDLANKFGIHLFPLYQQLIIMKIFAAGLDRPIYHTLKGPVIHPIYGEIRKIISAIESTLKEMGLGNEWTRAMGLLDRKDTFKPATDIEKEYMDMYDQDVFPRGKPSNKEGSD